MSAELVLQEEESIEEDTGEESTKDDHGRTLGEVGSGNGTRERVF